MIRNADKATAQRGQKPSPVWPHHWPRGWLRSHFQGWRGAFVGLHAGRYREVLQIVRTGVTVAAVVIPGTHQFKKFMRLLLSVLANQENIQRRRADPLQLLRQHRRPHQGATGRLPGPDRRHPRHHQPGLQGLRLRPGRRIAAPLDLQDNIELKDPPSVLTGRGLFSAPGFNGCTKP